MGWYVISESIFPPLKRESRDMSHECRHVPKLNNPRPIDNADSEFVVQWSFKYEKAESKGFDVVLSILWISIV